MTSKECKQIVLYIIVTLPIYGNFMMSLDVISLLFNYK